MTSLRNKINTLNSWMLPIYVVAGGAFAGLIASFAAIASFNIIFKFIDVKFYDLGVLEQHPIVKLCDKEFMAKRVRAQKKSFGVFNIECKSTDGNFYADKVNIEFPLDYSYELKSIAAKRPGYTYRMIASTPRAYFNMPIEHVLNGHNKKLSLATGGDSLTWNVSFYDFTRVANQELTQLQSIIMTAKGWRESGDMHVEGRSAE